MSRAHGVLYVVVCAAGPASEVGTLVNSAQAAGWDVYLFATPAALEFLDLSALETQAGRPVRSSYRGNGRPRGTTPHADAIIVAPASFNTINKLAAGIADNYVLTMLAEGIGIGVPVVVLPFINSALADRAPLQAAVARLRSEGVRVLLGPGQFEPHPPGHGRGRIAAFPWLRALDEATALAVRRPDR